VIPVPAGQPVGNYVVRLTQDGRSLMTKATIVR